jgi:hypothetical protein
MGQCAGMSPERSSTEARRGPASGCHGALSRAGAPAASRRTGQHRFGRAQAVRGLADAPCSTQTRCRSFLELGDKRLRGHQRTLRVPFGSPVTRRSTCRNARSTLHPQRRRQSPRARRQIRRRHGACSRGASIPRATRPIAWASVRKCPPTARVTSDEVPRSGDGADGIQAGKRLKWERARPQAQSQQQSIHQSPTLLLSRPPQPLPPRRKTCRRSAVERLARFAWSPITPPQLSRTRIWIAPVCGNVPWRGYSRRRDRMASSNTEPPAKATTDPAAIQIGE